MKRHYAKKFSVETWVGGELSEDEVTLEEYEVMRRPGEFVVLYALYFASRNYERLIAVYDDAAVAHEVARVAHEVLHLARLEFRRRRRRCKRS